MDDEEARTIGRRVRQIRYARRRMTAAGKRTDDGAQCTLLAVCETGGVWGALYPHGSDKLGVRLSAQEAQRVAQAIIAGSAE